MAEKTLRLKGKQAQAMAEQNALVRDGIAERVFVTELEAGDRLVAYDETVEKIRRLNDSCTMVYTNNNIYSFGRADTTLLVYIDKE